jgi:uncharacterized protein (TIGR02246 family)
MPSKKLILLWLYLAASTVTLPAQSPADEQAIRQRFAELDTAFSHHDAQQITNPKTAVTDADYINLTGAWIKGQEAFVGLMTQLQAGPFHDLTRHTIVEKIRFVRPDVAIVITTNVDRHGDGPPIESRSTYVLSKEEGHWLLNSFQNTQITAPPEPARPSQGAPGSQR